MLTARVFGTVLATLHGPQNEPPLVTIAPLAAGTIWPNAHTICLRKRLHSPNKVAYDTLVRRGIRNTLVPAEDVMGEAVGGSQAHRTGLEMQPYMLLLNLNMPEPSPSETQAYLPENCPDVKGVMLMAYDDA